MALTITTGGEPLEGQRLTAGPVELVVSTSYRATALAVRVADAPLSVTWTCEQDGRLWRTLVTADLSDVVGPVELAVQVATRGTTRQTFAVTVKPAHPWVRTADTGPRIPEAEMTTHPGGNLTVPGKVLSGVLFTGPVFVRAPDVTLRDCLARFTTSKGKMIAAVAPGLILDHCEVDGLGAGELGVGGSEFTATHCHVHALLDGFSHRFRRRDRRHLGAPLRRHRRTGVLSAQWCQAFAHRQRSVSSTTASCTTSTWAHRMTLGTPRQRPSSPHRLHLGGRLDVTAARAALCTPTTSVANRTTGVPAWSYLDCHSRQSRRPTWLTSCMTTAP